MCFWWISAHVHTQTLSVTSFKRRLKPSRWTKAVNRTRRNDRCDFWAHISDLNRVSLQSSEVSGSIYSTNTNAGVRSVFIFQHCPLDVHLILNEKLSPSLWYETHLKLSKGLFSCVNSYCVMNFQIYDDPAHKSWLCSCRESTELLGSVCVSHQSQNLQ